MADPKAYISQQISFSKDSQASGGSGFIRIERDPLLPGPDPSQDKSALYPGDTAYVAVTRNPENSYAVLRSGGNIWFVASRISASVENEILTFNQTKETSLSRYPYGTLSYRYIGNNPGVSPVFSHDKVIFPQEVTVVMSVNYTYLFDRWAIKNSAPGVIALTAVMDELKSGMSLEWSTSDSSGDDGDGEEVDNYIIEVRDYCTDEPLAGAVVSIDDSTVGVTNAAGQVDAGTLHRGRTYKLKIVKGGYFSSDEDTLKNDEFTVP